MNAQTEDNKLRAKTKINFFLEGADVDLFSNDDLDAVRKLKYINGREILQSNNRYLSDYRDACACSEYFKASKVDALIFIFCNYGQEEAIAKLAKDLDVPVLLWAPRDKIANPYDIYRQTDSQCGVFAASKVLRRHGIKFNYIENCDFEDAALSAGFANFLATARIVKNFRAGRIAQVSVRPQQFVNLMVNEGELLERFGIEVIPVTGAELLDTINGVLKKDEEDIQVLLNEIESTIDLSKVPDKRILAAIELGYMKIANRYGCNAIASDCWHTIRREYGFGPWFVFGDLFDHGLPCTNECDIHGAVSSLIALGALNNNSSAFLTDLTMRNPDDDNSELLWHMGFAKRLKDPHSEASVASTGEGNYRLMSGDLTIIRFDGDNGNYSCFVGTGESVHGPKTGGNYTYLKVDDWLKWEKKFVYGPYVHHVVGIFGDFRVAINDALVYLNIKPDSPSSDLHLPN